MESVPADGSLSGLSLEVLRSVINHVFLPPEHPQKDDANPQLHQALIEVVEMSLREFAGLVDADVPEIRTCLTMVGVFHDISNRFSGKVLSKSLSSLKRGATLAFWFEKQNAALLLTGAETEVIFESFEVLANNASVMGCRGRLTREFPDQAVGVPWAVMQDEGFLTSFTLALSELYSNTDPETLPQVCKAQEQLGEERDTISPILVTEWLMSFLRAHGHATAVETIRKQSREQVAWQDAHLPWHRSGLWLFLRVVLRLVFDRAAATKQETVAYYKQFMVIVCRLLKLETQVDIGKALWIGKVRSAVAWCSAVLKSRWDDVQRAESKKRRLNLDPLASLDFKKDTTLTAHTLREHLSWISSRSLGNHNGRADAPSQLRYQHLPGSVLPRVQDITMSFAEDKESELFALAEFEDWVQDHLSAWLGPHLTAGHRNAEVVLTWLHELITAYHDTAMRSGYTQDPESQSVMYLTIMELWVAVDKIAIAKEPLLNRANPEFPQGLLRCLLLPTKSQMQRLNDVEKYLQKRLLNSMPAFRNFGGSSSFAVHYVNQSPKHLELQSRILKLANDAKVAKIREFDEKMEEHRKISAQFDASSHSDEEVWSGCRYVSRCIKGCDKCRLRSQKGKIRIEKFEWPLPENTDHGKAFIFELDVPSVVSQWRETTLLILVSQLSKAPEGKAHEQIYYASKYRGHLIEMNGAGVMEAGSTAKPFLNAHYGRNAVHITDATRETVCLNHAARYDYYYVPMDMQTTQILGIASERIRIPSQCSYAGLFSDTLGRSMVQWIAAAGHDSNSVLAAQWQCPKSMLLEEFRELGHLRSGPRLQWMSILRQLAMPSLDLNAPETCALILQAATEAGEGEDGHLLRKCHRELEASAFGAALAEEISNTISRVEKSWENDTALYLMTRLTARLLSTTETESVRLSCIAILKHIRKTALQWTRSLFVKLATANAQGRKEFGGRVWKSAMICRETIAVEDELRTNVLCDETEATSVLQAMVFAHMHASHSTQDRFGGSLKQRARHINLAAANALRELIAGTNCLDRAITLFWESYHPGRGWSSVTGEPHVLESRTAPPLSAIGVSSHVSFNLLTGLLLVDGKPLDRLPAEYTRHETYRKLFEGAELVVVPPKLKGMHFTSAQSYHGWQLHFTLVGGELIVWAHQPDCPQDIWEFVPSSKLQGDFPNIFVDKFAHWLRRSTFDVEFRPWSNAWESSPDNWLISRQEHVLQRHGKILIDIRSNTFNQLSSVFQTIEQKSNCHAILDPLEGVVEIVLPRYDLSWSLKSRDTKIQSKQYLGNSIDEDQTVGALVGLNSMLVLTQENGLDQRMLLVPVGEVKPKRTSMGHVTVDIFHPGENAKHHIFQVDKRLGRLADERGAHGKLYLCYLHAVTSSCLPDTLTRRTGTEEALSILSSAVIRSFQRLEGPELELLSCISNLSPRRVYYPQHLTDMETIHWNDGLSVLSQPGDFYRLVKEIKSHGSRCELFFQNEGDNLPLATALPPSESATLLVERAASRASGFGVSGYGAEKRTTKHDRKYDGRGKRLSESAEKAYRVAKFLTTGRNGLLDKLGNTETLLSTLRSINGPESYGPSSITRRQRPDLCFSVEKLRDPRTVFQGHLRSLHEALAGTSLPRDQFKLGLFLSSLVFGHNSDWKFVQLLMGFASVSKIRDVEIPAFQHLDLTHGSKPDVAILKTLVKETSKTYMSCSERYLPRQGSESNAQLEDRRVKLYENNLTVAINEFVASLTKQWPVNGSDLVIPQTLACQIYLDVDDNRVEIRQKFDQWMVNMTFEKYLSEISRVAAALSPVRLGDGPVSTLGVINPLKSGQKGFISTKDILENASPDVLRHGPWTFANFVVQSSSSTRGTRDRFEALVENLRGSAHNRHDHRARYTEELNASFQRAHAHLTVGFRDHESLVREVANCLTKCREHLATITLQMTSALTSTSSVGQEIAVDAMQWPRVNPRFILSQLSRQNWPHLPRRWQRAVVHYALAIVDVDRAERLSRTVFGSVSDFTRETANVGHTTWDPMDHPEWLLLEVETGLIIREVQDSIARQMIDPPDGDNAVMQLNMGEGKSSVIVPIVSAHLADPSGQQLVRVIVGKPQMKQMIHVMGERIGGLLGRRLYFLPVSRSVTLDAAGIANIETMIKECIAEGGVLIVQPEHLLSFKLMALENLHSEDRLKSSLGTQLLRTQAWLDDVSRDIVDESDENFSVKFELIFTMGSQASMELSPHRWLLIQSVLELVAEAARQLYVMGEHTDGLDFDDRNGVGTFPRIRLLKPDVGAHIGSIVAANICERGLPGFPIHRQSQTFKDFALQYIVNPAVKPEVVTAIDSEDGGFATEHTRSVLLLLRGLVAGGILAFAFEQKRWTVNYGLAPKRKPATRLAVPYTAHDSPSPRSEFSHPDMVIVLTCLSYYYQHLSNDQMFESFALLYTSDQASQIYGEWVAKTGSLDSAFTYLQNVSMKDRVQCTERVFPHLSRLKKVIDYFLSELVFPKEMKQFPKKLSASGWDLAKRTARPMTGFSGTCDSKHMLPLSVRHLNLPEQQHTNATVLLCLLQEENKILELDPPPSQSSAQQDEHNLSAAESLIRQIASSQDDTQVILDVGAQVIELTNIEAARIWLGARVDKDAAIFFNEENLCVVDREDRVELFRESPYARQTGRCLVFLDQAHTRGIDLCLPDNYRAAVMLGPHVTKDTLVQACMRMRKLGKGQAVTFYVSTEIQGQIRQMQGKRGNSVSLSESTSTGGITVGDVIQWSIEQTFAYSTKSMPLWATQGIRHQRQEAIWQRRLASGSQNMTMSRADVEDYLEDEAQSLEHRYRPFAATGDAAATFRSALDDPLLASRGYELSQIKQRCEDFDIETFRSASLQEEQERELSPEIEQEREVQRPRERKPLPHSLHPHLSFFVRSGDIPVGSEAIMPAFKLLGPTSASKGFDLDQFPHQLFATADFATTVEKTSAGRNFDLMDSYQRPVHWLLSTTPEPRRNAPAFDGSGKLVIISDWEANILIPEIRQTGRVHLHLYAPRTNRAYAPLDHLVIYTVQGGRSHFEAAPWDPVRHPAAMLLNLFSGQLYLGSFGEYKALCRLLGLVAGGDNDGDGGSGGATTARLSADGFVGRTAENSNCTFTSSPVAFLAALMSIRRDGQDIGRTHLGRILAGDVLRESDFEEER